MNPIYVNMLKSGRVPQWVKKYRDYSFVDKQNTLYMGRGCLQAVIKYLNVHKLEYQYTDNTKSVPITSKFKSSVVMRDYQEPVLPEVLPHRNGVLKLSTGFGKTIIAMEIARSLRERTLIIVHRQHLMQSFINDFKKYYSDATLGIISGKQFSVGDITLATVQTLDRMKKKKELHKIQDLFGCVIVDECHEFITPNRLKTIQQFNSKYFFGMSGTPERTDKQDEAIGWVFGRIISEHELPRKKPTIEVHECDEKIPVREYHLIIEEHVRNVNRNKYIADLAKSHVKNGRKVLILVKRLEHIEHINNLFTDFLGYIPIYATLNATQKEQLFRELREGQKEFTILIGTYALLGTGSDIPSLDTMIVCGDLKSNVLSQQSIGRILRIFADKKDPKVIDIHDTNNPVLSKQFKARCKLYNKLNWKVTYDKRI